MRKNILICLLIISATRIYGQQYGFYPFQKDGKYGYMLENGEIVLAPQFEDAKVFTDGLAAVKLMDKWGYIDSSWNVVIDYQYSRVKSYINGVAIVVNGNNWGTINKEGESLIPLQYRKVKLHSDGLYYVQKIDTTARKKLYQLFKPNGQLFINKEFSRLYFFQNGYAYYELPNGNSGFINKSGKMILSSSSYKISGSYSDGLVAAQNKSTKKFGYLDINGNVKIPFRYSHAEEFSNDRAVVSLGMGRLGVINKSGQYVVQPKYCNIESFKYWVAVFWKCDNNGDVKYGLLNANGAVLAQAKYDYISSFYKGTALVSISGREGLINKNGQLITKLFDTKSTNIPDCNNCDHYVFRFSDDKMGIIDNNGKFIVKPVYDKLNYYHHNLAKATYNGQEGFVNRQGEFITPYTKGEAPNNIVETAESSSNLAKPIETESEVDNSLITLETKNSPYFNDISCLFTVSAKTQLTKTQFNAFENTVQNALLSSGRYFISELDSFKTHQNKSDITIAITDLITKHKGYKENGKSKGFTCNINYSIVIKNTFTKPKKFSSESTIDKTIKSIDILPHTTKEAAFKNALSYFKNAIEHFVYKSEPIALDVLNIEFDQKGNATFIVFKTPKKSFNINKIKFQIYDKSELRLLKTALNLGNSVGTVFYKKSEYPGQFKCKIKGDLKRTLAIYKGKESELYGYGTR
jgi:hypothetical protein